MRESKINSSASIMVIVYFNDFIIRTIDEDVAFICDESIYFMIMSFAKPNVGLCQGINVSTQKRMVRIKCRCLISIVCRNMKY